MLLLSWLCVCVAVAGVCGGCRCRFVRLCRRRRVCVWGGVCVCVALHVLSDYVLLASPLLGRILPLA